MRKVFILFLLVIYILYSLADKFEKKKKNFRSPGEPFKLGKGLKYPADIIESVQMDGLDDPKIEIEFAGMEDSDEEATISAAADDESEEDEDEEEEIVVPIKKKKLHKSKTEEDIHSFL